MKNLQQFAKTFGCNPFDTNATYDKIRATFRDGRQAIYTISILRAMMDDPDVIEIMDMQTGELYKF